MENIFNIIKLKIKCMEKTILGNLATTLSLTISMIGTINEIITALVLISAFLLNLSGIVKNLRKNDKRNNET